MCRGIIIASVILLAGCGQMSEMSLFNTASPGVHLLDMTGFAPAASGEGTVLRVFVQPDKIEQDLCFRFELYVYIPRSSNPRGKRIVLWPDMEVKANASSNSQWREHLKFVCFQLLPPYGSEGECLVKFPMAGASESIRICIAHGDPKSDSPRSSA